MTCTLTDILEVLNEEGTCSIATIEQRFSFENGECEEVLDMMDEIGIVECDENGTICVTEFGAEVLDLPLEKEE